MEVTLVGPKLLGYVWFVTDFSGYDPENDLALDYEGFITWRPDGHRPPKGADQIAAIHQVGSNPLVTFFFDEFDCCENIWCYTTDAGHRLIQGEQYEHSQFRHLNHPPRNQRELASRLSLQDRFEETRFGRVLAPSE